MPKETLNTRVSRLEEATIRAFDGIEKLDNVIVTLTENQIRLQEEQIKTEQRFRETDQRFRDLFRDLDERFQKTEERFQEVAARMDQLAEEDRRRAEEVKRIEGSLDERIDKLVSAIGELVRRRNGKT